MRLPAFNPHPEVVLLVVAMLGAYLWALRTLGPSRVLPGEPAATRAQRVSFVGGVATLFVAAWWPMHDLAERYLYSIHMVEHLLIMLVAPPLLLFGMPAWLLRWVLQARPLNWIVRHLARPFVGLVLFNAVLVLSHWPAVVTLSVQNEWFHFGAHTVLFSSALLMWWPVLSPLPEMPTLSYPGRMLYLFSACSRCLAAAACRSSLTRSPKSIGSGRPTSSVKETRRSSVSAGRGCSEVAVIKPQRWPSTTIGVPTEDWKPRSRTATPTGPEASA